MTTKFGFQCQFDSGNAERYNRELQPTHIMLINVVKREFLARLKADNPGVKLIYRHWPNYDWQNPTPEDAAQQAVAQLQAEIAPIRDLLSYITDDNEYILSKDHMALADIEAGDCYMAAFIKAARQMLGLGTCWGNFNTGHWGAETVDYFPFALISASTDGDSPICFHEYNWPTIPDPGFWTCGKVLRAMPPIVAQYPNVRCMVTEFGVDDGGNPHKGWSLVCDDSDVAADIFCDGVAWYRDEIMAKAIYLDAVLFFGCGMVSPWESFDVAPIIDDIRAVVGTVTPPEPPEPNGGTMEELKVYDLDNNLLTGAAAQDKIAYHGLTITQPILMAGQKFLQLVELREYVGPACFKFTVLRADGTPWVGIETAWAWTDNMGEADDICGANYTTDWQAQADTGPTKEDGTTAPGFGQTGWYHDPYKAGPGRAWIRHPEHWSTLLTGIGMIGMTYHQTMGGTWKLVTYASPTPPPPSGNLGTRIGAVITELTTIRAEVDRLGQVARVKLVMTDGSEVEFKPSASIASRAWATLRSAFGR